MFMTFAGVDETASIYDLQLFTGYDDIEWGILYSKTRTGSHYRYPSLNYISYLLDNIERNQLSLHICGSAIDEVISLGPKKFMLGFNRIQFNRKMRSAELDALANSLNQFKVPNEVIVPYVEGIDYTRYKFSVLYDFSGGRGIYTPEAWKPPISGIRCGYAGGINLENIKEVLTSLENYDNIWVDMESSLRTKKNHFSMLNVMRIYAAKHCG